ncbi:hypothetical protein [Janthinobacterium sp. CG_23.4]|jgi:hypothetical protein|uniref:hypothetical protein n=1 Tax=unclassified Janthinobacterium TaxID=2610881 RepID=UPI001300C448|nr:hypothetical protein [Janthinobacterium sp. CG_23.4]MCL6485228.1 hypothetical protein [Janthinobacterium lividum]MDH6159896.1 hypothetical protein [Janthinobacterium sp. CG_23.4]
MLFLQENNISKTEIHQQKQDDGAMMASWQRGSELQQRQIKHHHIGEPAVLVHK